jgi:hypothetical protein
MGSDWEVVRRFSFIVLYKAKIISSFLDDTHSELKSNVADLFYCSIHETLDLRIIMINKRISLWEVNMILAFSILNFEYWIANNMVR